MSSIYCSFPPQYYNYDQINATIQSHLNFSNNFNRSSLNTKEQFNELEFTFIRFDKQEHFNFIDIGTLKKKIMPIRYLPLLHCRFQKQACTRGFTQTNENLNYLVVGTVFLDRLLFIT